MSYYSGANPYTFAAGTLTSSTGSASVTVTAPSGTAAGDLLVALVYGAGDVTLAQDAGEGWVCLDCGYDSVNAFGLGLFACISTSAGATRNGLTLPSSFAWTCQNGYFRPPVGMLWDLTGKVGSQNFLSNAASAVTALRPAFRGAGLAPFGQGLQLLGFGYNNGGTTTTVGGITNWSERFDTGQTSPPHGVSLNDKLTLTAVDHYSSGLTGNLAVAKTNRAGVRAFVPLIGAAALDRRALDWRRTGS